LVYPGWYTVVYTRGGIPWYIPRVVHRLAYPRWYID